ncbi:unnamed protein product [Bathycoccus prasinos]|jgi:hypothetical protein
MWRKVWRSLPWIPVVWCANDAVVSVREIDAEKSGLKGIECSDEREQRRRLYAMLDKMSYRYWDVERGDAVHVPRPGSMYSSLSSSKEGKEKEAKSRPIRKHTMELQRVVEGKEKEAKSRPIRRHTMELQRVVALENDLVAWKETNAKTGGEEMKDALVPKGHCFIASEREEVEHVGIVPVGLIEAKVPYAVTVGGDRGGFFPGVNAIGISKTSLTTPIDSGRRVVVRRRYF